MEATFGTKAHQFYSGPVVSDLKAVGKRTMEWDLNDWNWDGDLFRATPLKNPLLSDAHNRHFLPVTNSSSSCSDEVIIVNDKGKRELEKRRRVVEHEEELNGSLNLKLGGQVYPMTEGEMEELEGKSGKKSKVVGATLSRLVCQVDDCRADLTTAKDYHRRHKVCDMHSKATRALVGKEMQRFCQQCSRFHVLQEFDDGKRSCRRRLAGHNRRRRKTHPENAVNGVPVIDERSSSYLLISLLRILSNIHSSNSDEMNDQVLLSHLLKNLGSLTSTINDTNLSALLNGRQDLQNAGTSKGTLEKDCRRPNGESVVVPPPTSQSTIVFPSKNMIPAEANALETTVGRQKMSNFDLNSVYDDSQECTENLESSETYVGTTLWVHQDSNKSSPPQTSGNSGSLSTLSPSTSSGEAQSRTDRIVFKLFGKDPTDLPLGLRNQIMEWLSHTPTDIESYIRPGCIILTIYLRMEKSVWEELYSDLSCNLRRLMDASTDSFWKTGWIYTRVRNRVAFAYNGQVVLDTPLKSDKSCKILSIKPIAVSISERAQFLVKGVNLSQSTTRLLCALEGKYLFQQSCLDMEGGGSFVEHEKVQSLGFPCSTPNVTGRGFIEVEDYGLSSSFFPFIVAEKDVCSEICTLERILEVAETADDLPLEKTEARNQALDFIHEMGWLLHKTHLKLKPGFVNTNSDSFPFKRFKWLIEFSIEHDWCAVVKKLLDISFTSTVDTGEHRSIEVAVQEIGPLHRAVRRNCRPMVDFLLNYYPEKSLDKPGSEKQPFDAGHMLFRPDAIGPGGLTPLHIAASRDGSENLLDALMDDPGLVGIEAWRSARDSTGLTPNDYACMRGHFSYIHIVQKKINNKKSAVGHVVLDIPTTIVESKIKQKLGDAHKSSAKVATFETEKTLSKPVQRQCNRCEQKLAYSTATTSLKFYRPAMLSMVGIAAVCVCAALLFKSSPEVHFSFKPFRWEGLDYGWS